MTPSDRPECPTVSIVIATYDRLQPLQRCIGRIRENVRIDHEVIIVGGAGADGTLSWASQQPDIRFIAETTRQGAARAYNRGFRAATGAYVMWLNDDSYPLGGAVEAAVALIERPDMTDVGMVAFYHDEDRERNKLDTVTLEGRSYSIYNVRGYPYANVGLLTRSLLAEVGYLDERYYFCGWDPDLALNIQLEAGLRVVGCPNALVRHDELMDARKTADLARIDADNEKLFAKWRLPSRGAYPDPAAAYQRVVCSRLSTR
jgi:GT2 family glycosyltransferase